MFSFIFGLASSFEDTRRTLLNMLKSIKVSIIKCLSHSNVNKCFFPIKVNAIKLQLNKIAIYFKLINFSGFMEISISFQLDTKFFIQSQTSFDLINEKYSNRRFMLFVTLFLLFDVYHQLQSLNENFYFTSDERKILKYFRSSSFILILKASFAV